LSEPSRKAAECVFAPAEALRGKRWDPAFWLHEGVGLGERCGLRCAPLGEFIRHITYGPILTGQRPQPVPKGVAIIDQKVIRATGVLLEQAVQVTDGCEYDLPRCRLERGDIVLCRSGAGTLARKRFTVFNKRRKATVSCFVDLIRLTGISPYYVVTFLRSRPGWSQIERLINGVGTPNLSFGEVRSLLIPRLAREEQDEIDAAWRKVERLHARGRLAAAGAALDGIAGRLERRLQGGNVIRGARPGQQV